MLPLDFELHKTPAFSSKEAKRLRKLEFVHQIGLIPILKMGDVNNEMEETNVIKFHGALNGSHISPEFEKGYGDGGSEISEDDVSELLSVNTSESTEVEDSDDNCSTASTRSPGDLKQKNEERGGTRQVEKPLNGRKTYEELVAENQELSKLLESKNLKIAEIKKNHDVISEENNLLALELQDIQIKTIEERKQLEENLQINVKTKEIFQQKIVAMRNGIRDMNGMLFELITQLNHQGNTDQQPVIHSGASIPNSSVVVPYVPPQTQAIHPSTPKAGNSRACTNVIQIALERMAPKMIEAATSKALSRSEPKGLGKVPKIVDSKAQLPQRRPHIPTDSQSKGNSPNKKLLHAVDRNREDKGFYCICGASLTTKLGLMTHINYHTYEGQFRCTVKECRKQFFATATLRQHMKAQHGIVYAGREGCRKCGETFVSRMQLYLHCKNIHKCGPLLAHRKRPGTASSFRNINSKVFRDLPTHEIKIPRTNTTRNYAGDQTHHEIDTSRTDKDASLYVCTCGSEFSSKRNLQRHIRYFYCEPRFPCKVCGIKYKGTNLLRQHMKTKHNMTFVGNGCRACGKVFHARTALYQHCKTAHNANLGGNNQSLEPKPIPIILEEGEERTPTQSKRQRKIPLKYIEESERYQQPTRQMPKQKRGVPLHAVDPNSLDEFKCICGNSFSKKPALLGHIQFKTKVSFLPCPVCNRRFPRRDILKNHLTSTHPDYDIGQYQNIVSAHVTKKKTIVSSEKAMVKRKSLSSPPHPPHGVAISNLETTEFKCFCGSEFKQARSLREHIRLKMELTQFKCDFCQDTFWRHDYLKMHLQKAHNIIASGFACRICGCGGFSSLQEVNQHRYVYHNKADGNQDPLLTIP